MVDGGSLPSMGNGGGPIFALIWLKSISLLPQVRNYVSELLNPQVRKHVILEIRSLKSAIA